MQVPGTRIYVGNLHSAEVDSAALREFFEQYMDVADAIVVYADGRSQGFGFVTLACESDLALALSCNGLLFHHRRLHVALAKPKDGNGRTG